MARPTKLDDRLIGEFCARLQMGCAISTACKLTGITEQTFRLWRRTVDAGKGSKTQKRLMAEVDRALGEAKSLAEMSILAAGKKNWTALAWYLERRYPEEYAKERNDTAPVERSVVVNLNTVPPPIEPEPEDDDS